MTQKTPTTPIALDCRGLACPQPVLECKQTIAADLPEQIEVLVDNDAAKENVTRFLESQGYTTSATGTAGKWAVSGVRPSGAASSASEVDCEVMTPEDLAGHAKQATGGQQRQQILVFIPAATMGDGDEALGQKLMAAFLKTLPEMGGELWQIVLVNGGVTLSTAESPVLEFLQALEQAGVKILVCGTCLEHFGLTASKAVGQTTNMLDIITSMQLASKVIRV